MVDFDGPEAPFRERLYRERKKLNLSQEELSDKLIEMVGERRTYRTAIAKIEGGVRPARIDEVMALADFFGCSVDALLGRDEPNVPRDKDFFLKELSVKVGQVTDMSDVRKELRSCIDDLKRFDLDADEAKAMAAAEALYEALGPVISQAESAGDQFGEITLRKYDFKGLETQMMKVARQMMIDDRQPQGRKSKGDSKK